PPHCRARQRHAPDLGMGLPRASRSPRSALPLPTPRSPRSALPLPTPRSPRSALPLPTPRAPLPPPRLPLARTSRSDIAPPPPRATPPPSMLPPSAPPPPARPLFTIRHRSCPFPAPAGSMGLQPTQPPHLCLGPLADAACLREIVHAEPSFHPHLHDRRGRRR